MRGTDGAEKSSESRSAAVPRFRQPQCGSSCLVVENCCCNNTVKKFETSVNAFLSLPALVTMKLSDHHILRMFFKIIHSLPCCSSEKIFPTYVKRHSENFPARCCINPSIHKSMWSSFRVFMHSGFVQFHINSPSFLMSLCGLLFLPTFVLTSNTTCSAVPISLV